MIGASVRPAEKGRYLELIVLHVPRLVGHAALRIELTLGRTVFPCGRAVRFAYSAWTGDAA